MSKIMDVSECKNVNFKNVDKNIYNEKGNKIGIIEDCYITNDNEKEIIIKGNIYDTEIIRNLEKKSIICGYK